MSAILCLIPLAVCLLGAKTGIWWLSLVAAGALFAAVALLPGARKRENLFMFVLSSFSLIPMNVSLIRGALSVGLLDGGTWLMQILTTVILYAILWNLEELLLGLITRLIWPKQFKLFSGIDG